MMLEISSANFVRKSYDKQKAAAVAQSVRALAPQAEGWVFESKVRQT